MISVTRIIVVKKVRNNDGFINVDASTYKDFVNAII